MLLADSALAEQPTIEQLMQKIDRLQNRVEQLEGQLASTKKSSPPRQQTTLAAPAKARPATPPPSAPAPPGGAAAVAQTPPAAAPPVTAAKAEQIAADAITAALNPNIPGLLPPEPMGNQFETEDALRSDLPGIAIRIPGTDTQVRFYGFAKGSWYYDLNGRNQTDVPTAQTIPLNNSRADQQGGEFAATARFSRFGLDSRTLTNLGTLETRLEGDFGGGTSGNALRRFR